jgi:tetratricopeptide (TPR) repeat protein
MAKLYVIRLRDGSESGPLDVDEVKKRIRDAQYNGSEIATLHPGTFAMELREIPEFERELAARSPQGDADATRIVSGYPRPGDSEKTRVSQLPREAASALHPLPAPDEPIPVPLVDFADSSIADEETRSIERPKELLSKDPLAKESRSRLPKKSFLLLALLAILTYEYAIEEDEEALSRNARQKVTLVPVRPALPPTSSERPNPQLSERLYSEGLKLYMQDTAKGYRGAAELYRKALFANPGNVKALAMLASTYLNLIESSNKDENTYSVINKLIQLSRMRELNLVETLIAEVEFLAAQRRYDAAIQKLIEHSKVTGKLDPALYYYLAWLFAQKGENAKAMNYLNQIPASALRIPRLYHLRGYLHEENKEYDEAIGEYNRALKLSKQHASSILGLVRVAEKAGNLKSRKGEILFLVANSSLQSPREYVSSLIYRAKMALSEKEMKQALWALENALEIEPRNETLRLEYYTLLSTLENDPKHQKLAQMYALVLDAERNLKEGNLHEAKAVLLKAQDTFPKSPVPFEKMGDLFYQSGEFLRAQYNYKKGFELAKDPGELAVKLIDTSIRNQEREEAQKLLFRFKDHPKLKSSVDRLSGDLAYHRGDFKGAVQFYRKAMSRDTIDTEVYSSYANLMREAEQCADAQFFYSLAQRLDPLSQNAISGSAKCLLKTDGVDSAVARIQEELVRLPKARAELVAAIAEIYFLANDDEKALRFAEQARTLDPDYPDSYLVAGKVYLRQMLSRKEAKSKALDALKSYSDRKTADPFGYLERFEIYLKDSDFEKAQAELERVFDVSPRYPQLHYKRSLMYSRMGRIKDALAELEAEIKISPRFDPAWVEQGAVYLRLNQVDEALKSYNQAMELNPKNAQAKIGAGYANYLKRQYPTAIALFQAALSLDRGNPDIYKKMGLAYRESGDLAKAGQFFRNYLDLAPDAPDRGEFENLAK